MKNLKEPQLEKQAVSRLKAELVQLKKEYANVTKLLNIAKPADLPPLTPQSNANKSKLLPVFGKKKKIAFQKPAQSEQPKPVEEYEDEEMEEKEKEDEMDEKKASTAEKSEKSPTSSNTDVDSIPIDSEKMIVSSLKNSVEGITTSCLPGELTQKTTLLINKIKKSIANKSQLKINWKLLNTKWCKVKTTISESEECSGTDLEEKMAELKEQLDEVDHLLPKDTSSSKNTEEPEKPKSKASARKKVQKEREKSETSHNKEVQDDERKQKKYAGGYNKDYEMWVPPSNQTGDGRTSLNDKLGY